MYKAYGKLISGITDFGILKDRQIAVLARLSALSPEQLGVSGLPSTDTGSALGCAPAATGRKAEPSRTSPACRPGLYPWRRMDACTCFSLSYACTYIWRLHKVLALLVPQAKWITWLYLMPELPGCLPCGGLWGTRGCPATHRNLR